jgi:hypothetical protein
MNSDCIERCYICLENLNDVDGKGKCGCFNRYHANCLETWLLIQNECPICKKKINETQNKIYHEEVQEEEEDNIELEVDDNDIFYNPLVRFIYVYIVYFIVLFLFNHVIYLFFMKIN